MLIKLRVSVRQGVSILTLYSHSFIFALLFSLSILTLTGQRKGNTQRPRWGRCHVLPSKAFQLKELLTQLPAQVLWQLNCTKSAPAGRNEQEQRLQPLCLLPAPCVPVGQSE